MSASALRSAAVAAAAARLGYSILRARPPGGADRWTRTNHRGEPISLFEGPAVAIGGMAGALVSGADARDRLAMVVAGAGAAAFGGYDDLAGSSGSKGFRGHLGALRKGELTTGAVKIAGIGATGLAAALIAAGSDGDSHGSAGGSVAGALADVVINAGLVAGGANLLNLFDLRPGRAIKVAIGASALLTPSRGGLVGSAGPLAAAVALSSEDLGEHAMLGDAGANALGAMLGVAAATALPRPARVAALAVVVGLTAASEVVSFTEVIERTGPLRWLDMLGRRPAQPRAPEPAAAATQVSGADASRAGDTVDTRDDAGADGTRAPRAPRARRPAAR
jgi:UDP-GlcNAc:undecaprenyl-phosphate/decaprenyl-phosphate GlcNAc-1-phosphate transferase